MQYSIKINNCNTKYLPLADNNSKTSTKYSTDGMENTTNSTPGEDMTNTTTDSTPTLAQGNSSTDQTASEYTSTSTTSRSSSAPPTDSHCPVFAYIQSAMLPSDYSLVIDNCGNVSECGKDILSPNVQDWTYIMIQIDSRYNVSDIEFDLQFETKGKKQLFYSIPPPSTYAHTNTNLAVLYAVKFCAAVCFMI